jgi:hypothetical protein
VLTSQTRHNAALNFQVATDAPAGGTRGGRGGGGEKSSEERFGVNGVHAEVLMRCAAAATHEILSDITLVE